MRRALPPHRMRRPLGYTLGDTSVATDTGSLGMPFDLPVNIIPSLQSVSTDAATTPTSVATIAAPSGLPSWLTPGVMIAAGGLLVLWLLSRRGG